MQELESLVARALREFGEAHAARALENAKARYLGKAGELSAFRPSEGSPEQRKAAGAAYNAAKQRLEAALEARRSELADAKLQSRLAEGALDVTLPGRGRGRGGIHPVVPTWQRVQPIWRSIGFDVGDGPEIETDWFKFTARDNPENHPARSMHAAFYADAQHHGS